MVQALGLNHGGLYAHFKSRDGLVEATLRHVVQHLDSSTGTPDDEAPLQRFIDSYLSSSHRVNPDTGCPRLTISAELGKRGELIVVTDEVECNRVVLREAGLGVEDAAEQSVLLLSAMVDVLLLSRSVKDAALSDHLLKTTKRQLTEQEQHTGA